MHGIEVAIYINLFKDMNAQTEKIKESLSKKSLNKRFKKNAVTLRSQAFSFAISFVFYFILIVANIFRKKFNFDPIILIVLGIFQTCSSNIALFVSSPDLRREYFGNDDSFVPNWMSKLKCF